MDLRTQVKLTVDVQVDHGLQLRVRRHRSVPNSTPEHRAVVLLLGSEGEDRSRSLVGHAPDGLYGLVNSFPVPSAKIRHTEDLQRV